MSPRKTFTQPALRFHRLWLAAGGILVLLVIYLSLAPSPPPLTKNQGDKLEHILAYAVLMSWFVNIYAEMTPRLRIAAGLIALGVALEFAQRWTGYRTFDMADMAANAAGVTAGWCTAPPRLPNYLRRIEKNFIA